MSLALGIFAAGSVLQGISQLRQGKRQQANYNRQADLIIESAEENLRRRELEDAQADALARALAASRGTGKIGAADQNYISFLSEERAKAREWDYEADLTSAEIMRQQGQDVRRASRVDALATGLQAFGIGRKWWG